ncbi:protein spaetzle 5-like isoform X2 [Onthophagus taurus]|uniref:protein spaetzle 5-like isoform X2 n=1 Tax=Onthophagus taurus TaxID=166361 RepID=UPI0039BE27DC
MNMNLFIFIIVILTIVNKCSSICTPVYGGEPCSFSPAPPGHVPNCARPGSTYCEHPSYYPGQVIQYLLEKWKFDHTTLLMDESKDDFNTYYVHSPQQDTNYFPEPIHIPKPQYPTFYPTSGGPHHYLPHQQHQNLTGYHPFGGYPDRRKPFPPFFEPYQTNQLVSYKTKNPFLSQPPRMYKFFGQNQNFNPNNWWKRDTQEQFLQPQLRRRRSLLNLRKKLTDVEYSFINDTSSQLIRKKRQNALTGQQLCDTTSQYIMPRAALNNKGDWKYVVNMPELDNRYTQLVKSETCASQQCNGICSLPTGYTSRCEQKYVQKRLIALETAGNQLYNDVFWFPSCCQCTITQN